VTAPGTNWETKEWRREAFAEVARHFMKKDFAVTLIGSERERRDARQNDLTVIKQHHRCQHVNQPPLKAIT
jgi:ADP-heptose:LPS heptosyltransferase